MYYTDDSILPENMAPLVITAAPYGPAWLPGDASDISVSWDEQVQAAVDCHKAGATMLHFHVRNPVTGMGSTNFEEYNYLLKRVKEAVPEMIIQVGGSISFSPHTADAKAKWLDYDTRHMLTELNPKPEFVTVTTGTTWRTRKCKRRGPAWSWTRRLPSMSSISNACEKMASSLTSFPPIFTSGSSSSGLFAPAFTWGP